jgi:hypothetical protein
VAEIGLDGASVVGVVGELITASMSQRRSDTTLVIPVIVGLAALTAATTAAFAATAAA